MITEIDEGKGLVKVYWRNVRDRVAKVEPTFAKIVDELEPDDSFPLYLAYYPYGALIGDTESQLYPTQDGKLYRLTDNNVPSSVVQDLGYGYGSSPLGIVLEKQFELFIDLKHKGISVPFGVYGPGDIFSFYTNLTKREKYQYSTNTVLTSASGVRSVFMLPNIGCATNHSNLQRDFNIKNPAPKSMYDHWHIFKNIINSDIINSDWRMCVLYFSEKWINQLQDNKAWAYLKAYLHELAWKRSQYTRSQDDYDLAFSVIQEKRNLKPNPYLVDTARHLFKIILGHAPGYAPACEDEALPLEIIQQVYTSSYGLKKYIPTVIHPVSFNFEKDINPIYYSLQHPSTYVFAPKSRKVFSKLFEMRELEYIMHVYFEELAKKNSFCSDSILCEVVKHIELNYFHNEVDRHKIVRPSAEILQLDNRLKYTSKNFQIENAMFASDAPFVRGCISITTKKDKA